MKMLSRSQFEQARQYLYTEARALERALFCYEFESGGEQQVLMELAAYQNSDGGFGNALEPDLRCKESSALATTVALQHLSLLTTSAEKEDMLIRSFEYFANRYKPDINGWEIIPQEADHNPRAIWWNYSPQTETWGNPNAEIIAYLLQYPHLLPEQLKQKTPTLLQDAIEYLRTSCACNEMHELFCYIRLYSVLSDEKQQIISREMNRFVESCVVKEPEQRNGYCAVPLQVVTSPDSSFYSKYEDVIPQDLDQLIDSMNGQGTWEPNWSWGRYEEQWEIAKKEWTGSITLNNLRVLKAFERIDFE